MGMEIETKASQAIRAALLGRTITNVEAPYGGSVGVQITLDDGTIVDFDPETSWDSGVLRVDVNGTQVSR
jgi:hypothetical protein